jgi:hypothetical protein
MIQIFFHFILVLVSFFAGPPNAERDAKSYQLTCQDISNAISSESAVYYAGERSFILSKLMLHVCGPQEVVAMQMAISTRRSLVRSHLHVQLNRGVQVM